MCNLNEPLKNALSGRFDVFESVARRPRIEDNWKLKHSSRVSCQLNFLRSWSFKSTQFNGWINPPYNLLRITLD